MTLHRLWPSTNGPASSVSDSTRYVLGVEFEASADCELTAFYFWLGSDGSTGERTFRLYEITGIDAGTTVTGTDLTTGSGGGAWTTSAWNRFELATPVALTAETPYRAVILTPSGGTSTHYTSTGGYWTGGGGGASGISSGILTAPNAANAAFGSGDQCSFFDGVTAMDYPTKAFNSSNYWVDIEVSDATDATVSPAAIAAVVAMPGPTVSVAAAPSVVTVPVAIPLAAAVVSSTVSPDPIAVVAALPAPTVSVGAAPAALAAVAALPQATVSVGAAPAVVACTVTLPGPVVAVGAAPAAVQAVVAIPQATPDDGETGDATASPAVITAVATLPGPTVSVGAAPNPITVPVAVPQATPAVHVTPTPAAIAATVTVPAVAVSVGVGPSAVAVIVLLPQATPDVGGGYQIHGRVLVILEGQVGPSQPGGPSGIIG